MIVRETGSAANIVQSFFSPEGAAVFVLGAVEVFNKPNSDLRHAIVQRMGRESLFISSVDYEQRRDSRVQSLNVGLGARLGRTVLQHLMTEPAQRRACWGCSSATAHSIWTSARCRITASATP